MTSWRRGHDGEIEDLDGDGPVDTDTWRPPLPGAGFSSAWPSPPPADERPVYRPVLGGVRHRTLLGRKPPDGTVVRLLDGDSYQVSSQRRRPAETDCAHCDALARERGLIT